MVYCEGEQRSVNSGHGQVIPQTDSNRYIGETPEEAGLPELCAKLPSLQKVILTAEFERQKAQNYFYTVERDENGAYKGASVKVQQNLQSPITSWEVTTTAYLP